MTAPDQCCISIKKALVNQAPSTHDPDSDIEPGRRERKSHSAAVFGRTAGVLSSRLQAQEGPRGKTKTSQRMDRRLDYDQGLSNGCTKGVSACLSGMTSSTVSNKT
jgi:hypothetical protein